MAVSIQSRTRVFPESRELSSMPKCVPLSIIDANVLMYATSGCVWFYPQPLDINRLMISLKKTLNAYPQWAGQLHFADFKPGAGHTQRQGRLILSYGSSSDPGVEWVIAHANAPMSSMVPPTKNTEHWDATEVDYLSLLDMEVPFALHNMVNYEGLPSMKVQITTFTDASMAITVGFSHPLGDAQSLIHFTRDWASTNLALSLSKLAPSLTPLFNPSLIDTAATGNIDAPEPEPSILRASSSLPLHRYDYWASATRACPEWALPKTRIPTELNAAEIDLSRSPVLPWETWDSETPVSHHNFFFSAAETHAIYLNAAATLGGLRISHQDALLAHFWAALITARRLREGEQCFLDVTIDVRRRLERPLPPSFVGSPILNAKISDRVTAFPDAKDVGQKAANIRSTVTEFTGEKIATLLHEMCFELGGQRRWNAFLGDRHVLATSWVGLGIEEVVFEEGKSARWAEPLMPPCDGCVVLREGGSEETGKSEEEASGVSGNRGKNEWWVRGVNVSVWLREDVMGRLVENGSLRAFAEAKGGW
ncbi:hypothetical protein MMC28_010134 [Mycoblastus sanguinarius]|nr:hypothetical protein [Mycoblastus sanguinarius]